MLAGDKDSPKLLTLDRRVFILWAMRFRFILFPSLKILQRCQMSVWFQGNTIIMTSNLADLGLHEIWRQDVLSLSEYRPIVIIHIFVDTRVHKKNKCCVARDCRLISHGNMTSIGSHYHLSHTHAHTHHSLPPHPYPQPKQLLLCDLWSIWFDKDVHVCFCQPLWTANFHHNYALEYFYNGMWLM